MQKQGFVNIYWLFYPTALWLKQEGGLDSFLYACLVWKYFSSPQGKSLIFLFAFLYIFIPVYKYLIWNYIEKILLVFHEKCFNRPFHEIPKSKWWPSIERSTVLWWCIMKVKCNLNSLLYSNVIRMVFAPNQLTQPRLGGQDDSRHYIFA